MLPSQRSLFSLPDGLHYLNCAYQSPLLRAAEAAGIAGVRAKSDPTGFTAADFFEPAARCRSRFADLVGGDASRVALVPAASYAMATVAKNLAPRPGQRLVVLGEQFPSHVYAWRRLAEDTGAEVATVAAPTPLGAPGRAAAWNARLLDAITADTALVAVPHVHWADGTVFDLVAVGARCREVGAALVVDGTQSIGALPFSVADVRPDAVAAAGYKWLLGPYTSGCLWLGDRFIDGRPLEENWIGRSGSDRFAGLTDYADAYAPGAVRFDVGERSSPILLPMLTAGLEQILAWGVDAVQARCAHLADRIVAGAAEVGWRAEGADGRAGHLFGLAPPDGTDLEAVRRALAARRVSVSVRGAALRVSPHVYNDEADADALVAALAAA